MKGGGLANVNRDLWEKSYQNKSYSVHKGGKDNEKAISNFLNGSFGIWFDYGQRY